MAHIETLQISNFRNLQSASIEPSSRFNICYGQNGAGKTSLLEAIYYFGFGRSFRSSNSSNLVQKSSSQFLLYSQLKIGDHIESIGIERAISGPHRIRHNKDTIRSIAPIAKLLPIQMISTDSYRFFHDGPKLRRQFMNWGLFHVKPAFHSSWQRLTQILKQRNAALKNRSPLAELKYWDEELIILANTIDQMRQEYVSDLTPIIQKLMNDVLEGLSLQICYQRGWDMNLEYGAALEQSRYKDQAIGYTTAGPHRADLQLIIENCAASDYLSQGQQKLAAYVIYLAQGQLLQNLSNKTPIYLIDDLPSELDPNKRAQISAVLSQLNAQVFISGITKEELSNTMALENAALFHVEHGVIQKEGRF
jgi:DNA replication and repair protein RecF